MKKLSLILAAFVIFGFGAAVLASTQYNWGTSTGGSWNTPDDTKVTAGQVLQIGSGSQVVSAAAIPLTLPQFSSTTLAGLTPNTTGQIVYANPSGTNAICISTGVGVGAWVYLSTPTAVCK